MSSTLKEIGVIIGEASSSEFLFASRTHGEIPSRWEYLLTNSEEEIDGKFVPVKVVAQVERVISSSQALTGGPDFEIIQKIIEADLADSKVWGKARILGFLTDTGELQQPKRAVTPGKPVFIAPVDVLKNFYSYPKDEAILLGNLITGNEVAVSLSIKGLGDIWQFSLKQVKARRILQEEYCG